jgi:hypothetical protein
VARARRLSADALRSWGMDSDVPAIELAVSELVAHAVRDGNGPAEMQLSAEGDTIRLEVTDLAGDAGGIDELGLWFVDEVADDWGVDRHPDRTRVWLVRHRNGVHPD